MNEEGVGPSQGHLCGHCHKKPKNAMGLLCDNCSNAIQEQTAATEEKCPKCGSRRESIGIASGIVYFECETHKDGDRVIQSRNCRQSRNALKTRVAELEAALREIAALQGHSAAYDLLNDVRTIAEAALAEKGAGA